jgi:hypothetical protein
VLAVSSCTVLSELAPRLAQKCHANSQTCNIPKTSGYQFFQTTTRWQTQHALAVKQVRVSDFDIHRYHKTDLITYRYSEAVRLEASSDFGTLSYTYCKRTRSGLPKVKQTHTQTHKQQNEPNIFRIVNASRPHIEAFLKGKGPNAGHPWGGSIVDLDRFSL